MQWPEKDQDAPIKPYNRRRCALTHSNCAVHVDTQVRLYAEWAYERGLKVIHIFPPRKAGYARMAYDALLKQHLMPLTRLVAVDPEDWK